MNRLPIQILNCALKNKTIEQICDIVLIDNGIFEMLDARNALPLQKDGRTMTHIHNPLISFILLQLINFHKKCNWKRQNCSILASLDLVNHGPWIANFHLI